MIKAEPLVVRSLQLAEGPVRSVVFDLNGVLTTDMNRNLAHLNQLYDTSMEPKAIREVWWPLYLAASVGDIDARELWHRLGQVVAGGELPRREPSRYWLSLIGPRESGLRQTLGQLGRHYSLGVMSNHVGEWARSLLARFGLSPLVDAVLISSDLGVRKPAEEIYARICEMLNVEPSSAIYVADEEEDLLAAAGIGMRPVFLPGEEATSAVGVEIRRVSDLLPLLQHARASSAVLESGQSSGM